MVFERSTIVSQNLFELLKKGRFEARDHAENPGATTYTTTHTVPDDEIWILLSAKLQAAGGTLSSVYLNVRKRSSGTSYQFLINPDSPSGALHYSWPSGETKANVCNQGPYFLFPQDVLVFGAASSANITIWLENFAFIRLQLDKTKVQL